MTNPEKKARGISAFLVDAETPGFDRSRHQVKLGVNASGTVEIFLTDVVVPVENRLGEEGDGFKIAMSTLDGGRIGIAAQAVGIATEALEAAIALREAARSAFGKPISDFQVDPLLPRRHGDGAGRGPSPDPPRRRGQGHGQSDRGPLRSRGRHRRSSSRPRWRSA